MFGTKNRQHVLASKNRPDLFRYIAGILKNKNCHLYQIGGVADHIHIVTHIHPTVSLSSLVKDIKMASSHEIKQHQWFLNFSGWQEGYGAFTYSIKEKENLINYVKNQEEHHKIKTFKEEYEDLLIDHGIEYEEKYML